jgi:hypothetical protein
MQLSVELEGEGRWVPIGELEQLPGVVGVGVKREKAMAAVQAIASQMLTDEWIEDARHRRLPFRIPVEG